MRIRSKLVVLCLVCPFCLRLSAQDGRNALLSLPPFERAIVCIKHFEGLHGFKDAPYVGYGHKLQKGERFTAAMTERHADSLLRADLTKRLMIFKDYGKDALPSCPIMSEWADCWDTANIPKADCYER